MKRSMRYIAIGCSLLLLAACAKPTMQTPTISAAEVKAERNNMLKGAHGVVQREFDNDYTKQEIKAMHARLQRITDKLEPEATKLCHELNGPKGNCDMRVTLSTKQKGLNAFADGKKIVIFANMVDFADDDDQLALVLAHEYVHHIMKHVQASQRNVGAGAILGTIIDAVASSQGMNTGGQLGKLGAQAALLSYSPSFEQEADYVAMYILARAGFNINDAPDFWRKMSRNNPQGIYNRTTHPTTPERFVMLNKTINEINAKKRAGKPLLPNLKPQD